MEVLIGEKDISLISIDPIIFALKQILWSNTFEGMRWEQILVIWSVFRKQPVFSNFTETDKILFII